MTEPALFALEHVGHGLQRTLIGAGNGAATAAVVEQSVDGFLQHPFFVADDDFRRMQLDQPFQPVVPVDDAAIEVVEVRGGEPATIQRDQRAQLRRNNRNDFKDHPFRPGAGFKKRLDQLQPLDELFALGFRIGFSQVLAKSLAFFFKVDRLEHLANGFGADADGERVFAVFVNRVLILIFAHKLVQLERRQPGFNNDVVFKIQDPFEILQSHIDKKADTAGKRFQEPDMGDRRSQLDMAHALAPDLLQRYLDPALFACDALVLHAFVFAAQALIILNRAKNTGTEQAVAFRLECPVIDRFRLLDFTK